MNSAGIFLHDLADRIESDPDFVKKLRWAMNSGDGRIEFDGLKLLPAIHSSSIQIVAVGGNTIRELGFGNYDDDDVALLKKFADRLGYNISKKPEKKR